MSHSMLNAMVAMRSTAGIASTTSESHCFIIHTDESCRLEPIRHLGNNCWVELVSYESAIALGAA